MRETDSEFHLVVTGMRRDGRRRYDDDSKLALVKACLRPGVSLAGMALKHGVNANLLRKWVVGHQLAVDALTKPAPNRMDAFIPVMLGIKATAFLFLSICAGKTIDEVDTVLSANLNSFGKDRGDVAHKNVTHTNSLQAPSTELTTVKSLIMQIAAYFDVRP